MARRLVYAPVDAWEAATGKRPALVPPKGMTFIGPGDFVRIGDTLLQNFIDLCHLQPEAHVLDVGCGIGRVARPLTRYLSEEGRYDGFDIVPEGIRWCQRHYSRFPNFHFRHIHLRNDLYNLETETEASSFTFPYPTDEYDLVVLTSVFTHMQEEAVRNYLSEIGRVLKPGGCCFCTFFLITKASEAFLDSSSEPFFKYRYEHYYLHNAQVKDANIAYKYSVVEQMVQKAGLKVQSFHPGWWAGLKKEEAVNFQDVLILTK